MLKRIITSILIITLFIGITSCGTATTEESAGSHDSKPAEESGSQAVSPSIVESDKGEKEAAPEPEELGADSEESISESVMEESEDILETEEEIDDPAWDDLEALGRIKTENGVFFVTITIPAEFEEETTQEELDKLVGVKYVSAIKNEDGSVTYKMTKAQHKASMEETAASIDRGLQEMVDSGEYSFTEINHNDDYTYFEVKMSTNEFGWNDIFSVILFEVDGSLYGLLAGHENEIITVEFYNPDGEMIGSWDSTQPIGFE